MKKIVPAMFIKVNFAKGSAKIYLTLNLISQNSSSEQWVNFVGTGCNLGR